jgi:hypothetical protein
VDSRAAIPGATPRVVMRDMLNRSDGFISKNPATFFTIDTKDLAYADLANQYSSLQKVSILTRNDRKDKKWPFPMYISEVFNKDNSTHSLAVE